MPQPAARPINPVMPRSRWGSVKLRLAAIGALLIALSVALTVGLTLRTVDEYDEQLALDLSLAQTRKMAKLISARLVSLQLGLRSAADGLDVQRPIDAAAALACLRDRRELKSQFDTLYVARPDGQMLAFRDEKDARTPAFGIGDRPYFQQTIAQQRPVVSQPLLGRGSSEPVVVLTMPVRGADGRIIAVIGGGMRLASRDVMPEITATDEDDPARTVIVDVQGRVLSHPDRAWLMRDAASEPGLAGGMAHWVAQGRPIEPSGLAGRFGDQLVTMAGVPDAEWVVVRSAAMALVLGGRAAAQRRALAVGAAVAFGGGLLLLLATFFMLRPLRRIEACSLATMQGLPPDAAEWPQADNEFGHLASVLRQALDERSRADAAGRELLDRLQAVMSHAPVGIAFTRERRFEAVSAHFERLLGYPAGGLVGAPPRVIYASDEFYEAMGTRVAAAFEAHQRFDEEIELQHRSGRRFWGRLCGQPVRWGDAVAGTIWTLEDVTEQRHQRKTLAWASSHDALTRLANRAEFERRLSAQCGERRLHEAASVLFIDLDRFKAVNDSAGHAAGDAVLVAVARALEEQVRHADTVARLGGDEFAVLLNCCNRVGAAGVSEKMRAAVEALRVPWSGDALTVGACIGVVEVEPALPDAAAVLAAADAACYAAKRDGRNGVRVHGVADLRLVGA
jgi:diguanylate cyclase (GGDEF)-like protein/PAS domain S-box-containing protein